MDQWIYITFINCNQYIALFSRLDKETLDLKAGKYLDYFNIKQKTSKENPVVVKIDFNEILYFSENFYKNAAPCLLGNFNKQNCFPPTMVFYHFI